MANKISECLDPDSDFWLDPDLTNTDPKPASFIFCWIQNKNSVSRQKFRIHGNQDPAHYILAISGAATLHKRCPVFMFFITSEIVVNAYLYCRCWQYRQLTKVHRCPRPTRPDRARRLGFKNKQGNKSSTFSSFSDSHRFYADPGPQNVHPHSDPEMSFRILDPQINLRIRILEAFLWIRITAVGFRDELSCTTLSRVLRG